MLQSLNSCMSRRYLIHPAAGLRVSYLTRNNVYLPENSGQTFFWRKGATSGSAIWHRNLKTVSKRRLNDLPQGSLDVRPVEKTAQPSDYPTVIKQARENMLQYEDCVLLTRVGGFYEMYFEQAEKYGRLLNLKVARKNTLAGPVPMAGFPFFQADRYLKMLVQDMDLSVAMSEEFPLEVSGRVKSGGLLFDRRVARIISAGTLIDENFMDPYENNFLLAIQLQHALPSSQNVEILNAEHEDASTASIGLAWMDLSTGDFFTQKCAPAVLHSAVSSIGPREIIIDRGTENSEAESNSILSALRNYPVTSNSYGGKFSDISSWSTVLEAPISSESTSMLSSEEISAAAHLLEYGTSHLRGLGLKLQHPVQRHTSENMAIDRSTTRALEIKETISKGTLKGSLLHAVRRTVTKSGSRLLSSRLSSPSAISEEIERRLDLISFFLRLNDLRDQILLLLQGTSDSQRLVQKTSLGRGDPDDLLSLKKTIFTADQIIEALQPNVNPDDSLDNAQHLLTAQKLVARFHRREPLALAERINDALDEQGVQESHEIADNAAAEMSELTEQVLNVAPADVTSKTLKQNSKPKSPRTILAPARDIEDEVWIMKRLASETLEDLHSQMDRLRSTRDELADALREKLGMSSLSLRWTPGLGHICHVKGKDASLPLTNVEGARSVTSSRSTRSFYFPAWTELGKSMDQLKLRIRAEEQKVFKELSQEVILNLQYLRRNAIVLDELDIACSSALFAQEQNLVRPVITNGNSHKIIAGHHPTVDAGLQDNGRSFTPNDCILDTQKRIWLITGPNMGGKSTFLRQNALIYVLAQAGMFVPAKYAELGVVDKLFTRVGSADNLSGDQSTFMVEMIETASIINGATERSFVIMDEVGRGTTPEDGIAIGAACLNHLHNKTKCRTLFATHYHSLADMLSELDGISCYNTRLHTNADKSFHFDYRIQPGVNRESHALKTALLAGLPKSVIDDARSTLHKLKQEVA